MAFGVKVAGGQCFQRAFFRDFAVFTASDRFFPGPIP